MPAGLLTANHQHLRAFHAIAVEGSVSRAARRLNVAQPTLSQQIKALETRHKAALFERRRPPLILTPMGRDLFALTERMFATSEEIDDLLGDRIAAAPRAIRLGADSPNYAARLVRALMLSNPEIELEVHIDNARDTLRGLQNAAVDVAIVSDPPMDNQFFYEPLFADFLNVAVHAGHFLAGAPEFPLHTLATEVLLVREPASKTRAATELLLAAAEIDPARVLEFHSREAIREAIALGIGVSLLFSTECPPDSRLVFLPPDRQGDRTQLTGYLVGRSDHRRTAAMRAILQAAQTLKALSPRPVN